MIYAKGEKPHVNIKKAWDHGAKRSTAVTVQISSVAAQPPASRYNSHLQIEIIAAAVLHS